MRLAAYCRVSTDKEEQLHSLESQKSFFGEFAEKNCHELVKLYADEGISGTSLRKRAEFNKLIEDAKLGLFDIVAVKDVSRMARNTVDFLQSIRTLKSMGINTIFVTANMSSLGDSEFILTIFGALAQEESANLSKRVKFGKLINSQRGRVPRVIFGYDRIDNFTLAVNPTEGEVIRKIFDLYVNHGFGCRKIALTLNDDGDLTKFGNKWDSTAIKRIVSNPIYCGELVNHKYEVKDYLVGKMIPLPEEEHLHHDRPELAIISRETWDAAQKILEGRRKLYDSGEPFKQARYSNRHAFSTLIKCSHCGGSFSRRSYTYVNTRVYWICATHNQTTSKVCPNSITVDESDLIKTLTDYLSSLIEDRESFVKSVVDDVMERANRNGDRDTEASLKKKLDTISKKKERAQDMYLNELISLEQLKAMQKKLSDEADDISMKLASLDIYAKLSEEKVEELARQYTDEVERFLSLETITNADVRRVIENVVVSPDGKVVINIKKIAEL